MLSRSFRRTGAVLTLPLLALSLAACGSEPEEETAQGFDAVEITGQPGETPEFSWDAKLEADEAVTEVLSEGDGPVLKKGQKVLVNVAVSNDWDQRVTYDTFGEEMAASQLEVGAEAQPTVASDLVVQLVADQITPDETTLGTRYAVVLESDKEWADFNVVELGVGNEDGVAAVIELSSVVRPGPTPEPKAPAAWAPTVEKGEGGVPTGLDSRGIPKPDVKGEDVRVTTVLEGNGEPVEKGDLAVVDYLGQTWGGEEPFDQSYGKDKEPLAVNVGAGVTGGGINVIDGWSEGLVGVPVGSRIIIEIPPAKGYGKKGQEPDIKGDDILYFVVDVLGAA